MNKSKVEALIPKAYEAIISSKIAENNVIKGNYRAQISTFGAAVSMGSLLAAVAFFSKQNDAANADRKKMIRAIEIVLGLSESLFDSVKAKKVQKDQVMDAVIALKLAMNLFILDKGNA